MGKIIGITYDLKSDCNIDDNSPQDIHAEFDYPETIDIIANAFESGGHTVRKIGNVFSLMNNIENLGVDIIFNICEGIKGRNRESQVPNLLEVLNIPYVGSDGLTMALTLDKIFAKKIFLQAGLPTPRFFQATGTADLEKINSIGYPLIVKTRHEGSSKGIDENSRVEDLQGLQREVHKINSLYHQPALVEEFIRGQELTVAVIGNEDAEAMPVVQVSIDGQVDLGDRFYTFERISSDALQYICPAKISEDLQKKVKDLAVKAYKAVECKDFGRVDFRVNEQGDPYILEINPLPSLMLIDVFNLFPQVIGSTYEKTLNRILDIALERNGIK